METILPLIKLNLQLDISVDVIIELKNLFNLYFLRTAFTLSSDAFDTKQIRILFFFKICNIENN